VSYNELKQRGTHNFPIELYEISDSHPKYEMAHHWHTEIEIIKIVRGSLNMRLNHREFTAVEGDIVFVNSETVHGGMPDDCIYDCIVFSPDMISGADKICGGFLADMENHVLVVNDHFHKEDVAFCDAADELFSAMKGGTYFEVMAALYGLFAVILKNKYFKLVSELTEGSVKNNMKLKKVLTFIRESYDSQVTLDEMASAAGMSPKYFCYFFKEMTTKSPVEYLNTYRIERASRKLLSSDMSITDIAFSCGFNDLSYFIKMFKAIKGVTPKAFRKRAE